MVWLLLETYSWSRHVRPLRLPATLPIAPSRHVPNDLTSIKEKSLKEMAANVHNQEQLNDQYFYCVVFRKKINVQQQIPFPRRANAMRAILR